MSDKKYYVVTAISQHWIKYVIPVEDITSETGEVKKEWALDSVTMGEVEEFSQMHIGENIIDVIEENEEEIISRFDEENSYLKKWDLEQKLNYIKNWRYKP